MQDIIGEESISQSQIEEYSTAIEEELIASIKFFKDKAGQELEDAALSAGTWTSASLN